MTLAALLAGAAPIGTRGPSASRSGRRLPLALAALLTGAVVAPTAEAYKFSRTTGLGRRRNRLRVVLAALFSCVGAAETADAYRRSSSCPWDPTVWGPGETLVFTLSSLNWPEDGQMTPNEAIDLLNELIGEYAAVPSADISIRIEGPVDDLEPGRDGKNIFFVQPDYEHGVRGSQSWCEHRNDGYYRVEADHTLGRPSRVSSPATSWNDPWRRIASNIGMHPLGHLLGLGHAATFPTFRRCGEHYPTRATTDREWNAFLRSCPGNLAQWRAVSGAWEFDPIMSYGQSSTRTFTEAGGTLRLDDRIGVSLLRPKPGWLETTGTIAGSIRLEGEPVPFIHVWALRQTEGGLVDGVGAFANREGDFQIEGLPPGYWFLLAHPDPDWWANPRFFYEDQGDLRDVFRSRPVLARAGAVTGGIEFVMSRGRSRNLLPAETR